VSLSQGGQQVAFTVVACDDGEVRKLGGGLTTVACVAYRGLWPSDASLGIIRVDGLDATSVLSGMISLMARPPGAVLLDSITIGGFNVVSLPGLSRLTGMPAIVVYSYEPSFERLEAPLRQHFADAELRLRALAPVRGARRVMTRGGSSTSLPGALSSARRLRSLRPTSTSPRSLSP
jgi:Uncharacterized conserved protein